MLLNLEAHVASAEGKAFNLFFLEVLIELLLRRQRTYKAEETISRLQHLLNEENKPLLTLLAESSEWAGK